MAVACDHQTRERCVGWPQRFHRVRHGAARLARSQYQRAPIRRGQVGGCVVQRQRALNRHVVQVAEQGAGIAQFSGKVVLH